jgi:hypothetical protein
MVLITYSAGSDDFNHVYSKFYISYEKLKVSHAATAAMCVAATAMTATTIT